MFITTKNLQFNELFLSEKSNSYISKIAKYIHQTDKYIYPYLYEEECDPSWIEIISCCLSHPENLFYYKNIIAVLDHDEIIGLANVVKCGQKHTFMDYVPVCAPPYSNLCNSKPNTNYFRPLINEIENLDGYYLCNFCIDEKYRNQGIGHHLLKEVIRLNPETIHTDALSDNASAIKVYKDNGFVITEKFTGYSGEHPKGLECVKLIKE